MRTSHLVASLFSASIGLGALAQASVPDKVLEKRASFAMGVPIGTFGINQVEQDGIRTEFKATTHDGQEFACYVTSVKVDGLLNVSDAICTQIKGDKRGALPENPLLQRTR